MNIKDKILVEIARLKKVYKPSDDKDYAQYELDVKCGQDMALDDILRFINSLPEEPVSENLEEVSRQYATDYTSNDNGNGGDDWEDDIAIAFKAGARWQKEQQLKGE